MDTIQNAVPPLQTQCCIAGCGPAGAMLGFLLARRGDRCGRAGETWRLSARLSRRYHSPLDVSSHARAWIGRRTPQSAAHDCADAERVDRTACHHGGRLPPSKYALALSHLSSTMGFLELAHRESQAHVYQEETSSITV
jgi:hypothetical protein